MTKEPEGLLDVERDSEVEESNNLEISGDILGIKGLKIACDLILTGAKFVILTFTNCKGEEFTVKLKRK